MDHEGDDLAGAHVGGCTIVRKLAAGGMGSVYLARHEALARQYVIKFLDHSPAARDPEHEQRFLREGRTMADLAHPNIVQVHDAGRFRDRLYIRMDYIEGEDLARRVERDGPLDAERASHYVLQAAEGLAFAHRHGVLHRDVKPANLLVDADDEVKVVDFGLAGLEDGADGITRPGQLLGTPCYIAPELWRGGRADAQSEVYALGVTYYYLVTGALPYSHAGGQSRYTPPEVHRPGLPPAVAGLIGDMTGEDLDRRPASMVAVVTRIEVALAGPQAPARRGRRRSALLAAGALLLAALAAAAWWGPWSAGHGAPQPTPEDTQVYTRYLAALQRDLGVDLASERARALARDLALGTLGRGELVLDLLTSEEGRDRWIDVHCRRLLGRPASEADRRRYGEVLRDAMGFGLEELVMALVSSEEYRERHPPPEAFVAALYRHVLDREPTAEEVSGHVDELVASGNDLARKARDFHRSLENRRRLVGETYRRLLGRPPNARELTSSLVQDGTGGDVEATTMLHLLASEDYFLRQQ